MLPPEVMANIEAKYGLDKPVFEQYTTYLTNILQGDFGPSLKYQDAHCANELIWYVLSSIREGVGLNALIPQLLLMGVMVVNHCRLEAQHLILTTPRMSTPPQPGR